MKFKSTIGILRYKEGILKVCLLKYLFFLLVSFCKISLFGYILGVPLMEQIWAVGSKTDQIGHVYTAQHPHPTTPNFAIVQESDQESSSEGSEDGEETQAGTAINVFLWGFDEQHRTKSTLAKCTATKYRRVKLPLFVLYHTWKDFPA